MGLFNTLQYISQHPYNRNNKLHALWRFIRWQIRSRLTDAPLVYAFTDKAKLIIRKGMTGATGNLYCGLHEFHDMGFLLHMLREEDTFMDIGANVGTYTVLASAHVGAKSIALEPVPAAYNHLMNNINLNQINQKVASYNMALGSEKGEVAFTNSLDTTNHVAQPGEINTLTVPVETIDSILENHPIPILIKIDVEGFETEVIQGASTTLKQESLKAIIIELAGAGIRYGFDEDKVKKKIIELGFTPFQYNPFNRELTDTKFDQMGNVIYIRDIPFVQQRLQTAAKVALPAMAI